MQIDSKLIEQRLGIAVVPFVAADRKNYQEFHRAIARAVNTKSKLQADGLIEHYRSIEGGVFDKLLRLMPPHGAQRYSAAWLAAKALEGDQHVMGQLSTLLTKEQLQKVDQELSELQGAALAIGGCKFRWVDDVIAGAVVDQAPQKVLSRFDKIATSRRWGKPLAILILLAGLLGSFVPAAPIMMLSKPIMQLGGRLPHCFPPSMCPL